MSAQPKPLADAQELSAEACTPELLVTWESSWRVFFSNLAETLGCWHRLRLPAGAAEAPFNCALIEERHYRKAACCSLVLHMVLLGMLFAVRRLPVAELGVESPLRSARISYYAVSEFLPALAQTISVPKPEAPKQNLPAKAEAKSQPALAKQEIRAVATDAEPSRQTLTTPVRVPLADLPPLPNLVATAPKAVLEVPLEVVAASKRHRNPLPAEVAPPMADLPVAAALKLPEKIHAVTAPESTKVGALENPPVLLPAHPPKLPVPQVMAETPPRPPAPETAPPLPAPSAHELSLLALSTKPAEVQGQIDVPLGVREGQLAASPQGKLEGDGAAPAPAPAETVSAPAKSPEQPASDAAKSPPAPAAASNPKPEKVEPTLMAKVSPPLAPAAPSATVVVAGVPKAKTPALRDFITSARAAVTPPPIAPKAAPAPPLRPAPGTVEEQIFGVRGYYLLTVNMPNMTSAAGSWEIHFSELRSRASNGTPPVAEEPASGAGLQGLTPIQKVDPAYPAELMRSEVEGVVMLYAVIHADGSVGRIRLLSGVNERLNANAAAAFAKWRFQPALRDGKPVELEAVVKVPFRVRKLSF
jgi:protein TonB